MNPARQAIAFPSGPPPRAHGARAGACFSRTVCIDVWGLMAASAYNLRWMSSLRNYPVSLTSHPGVIGFARVLEGGEIGTVDGKGTAWVS